MGIANFENGWDETRDVSREAAQAVGDELDINGPRRGERRVLIQTLQHFQSSHHGKRTGLDV